MTNLQEIVMEYQKGDWNRRLCLFLEHPALRTAFMDIDQTEIPKEEKAKGGWFCLSALFSQFIAGMKGH